MIRLGIVGFGHIGRIHAEVAGHLPGAELAAIGTSRAEEVRRAHGPEAAVYNSYSEALQHPGLNAVVICVPTHLHEQFVMEALEQGLAVLCEKPFSLDVASSQRMLDAARRTQRCLMIAQVLRFWPPYVRIRQLIRDDAIGPIQAVAAYRLAQYPPWGHWFRDPAKSGGAMLDMQVHDADFVYWLLGSPQEVYAAGLQSQTGSWDQVMTLLRYANAVASMESTYLMPPSWPFACGIRVAGSRGCLEFSFRVAGNVEKRKEAESRLLLYANDGTVKEPAVANDDMYLAQLRYFVDCVVRNQSPDRCPPEETLEVMKIMSACRQSLSTRLPVRLRGVVEI
jgi:UDP-N-acetylglucosamine 3-dehydrogenase